MEKELREKFEAMVKEATGSELALWKSEAVLCMQAAYNLAKQEDAEMVKAQSELLESMGETNKQLAKRLWAIKTIVTTKLKTRLSSGAKSKAAENIQFAEIKILNELYDILNPAAPLIDGL